MSAFETVLSDIFDRGAQHPIETIEEERDLLAAAKLGDSDATVALMYAYAPALRNGVKWYSRATRFTEGGTELEDAKGYAVQGIVEAIAAFNPETHSRLATIVSEHITQHVSEAAGSTVSKFAVPARSLKRFYSILRAAEGNVYEAAAIAPEYKMKRETFFAILSSVSAVDSYDGSASSEEDGAGLDTLAAYDVQGPVMADTEIVEDAILVEAAFGAVDDLEADVCRLAYGFADYDPCSDAETAHRLGLSRPKTQRVRASALGKMRVALGVA